MELKNFFNEICDAQFLSAPEGQAMLIIAKSAEPSNPIAGIYSIDNQKLKAKNGKGVLSSLNGNKFYLFSKGITDSLGIPLITVLFPIKRKENLSKNFFFVTEDAFINYHLFSSSKLQVYLLRLLNIEKTDNPPKRVNKRTSDLFHDWSRRHLPSGPNGIIKCDIDGVFLPRGNNAPIIIEIKRSDIPKIPDWVPRKADYTGLELLRGVAIHTNYQFIIMHHEENVINYDTHISVFWVNSSMPIGPEGPTYLEEFNPITVQRAIQIMGIE